MEQPQSSVFLWRRLEPNLGMDGEVRKLCYVCKEEPRSSAMYVCMYVWRSMAAKLRMYGDAWKLRFVLRSLDAQLLMEGTGR